MNGEHLKTNLVSMQTALGELEASARKLENQNFADLIKHASGRLAQATEHPDLDLVAAQAGEDMEANQTKFPFESDPA